MRKSKAPPYTIRFTGNPHPEAILVAQASLLGLRLPGEPMEMVRAAPAVRVAARIAYVEAEKAAAQAARGARPDETQFRS